MNNITGLLLYQCQRLFRAIVFAAGNKVGSVYKDLVLKAVNLGEDTDTTGAVTGGLAGMLYGFDGIPTNWIKQIARNAEIENLAERLGGKIASI